MNENTHEKERHALGGPYPSPAARLPLLWDAGQRVLAMAKEAFPDVASLQLNDLAYVEARDRMQTLHKDLLLFLHSQNMLVSFSPPFADSF